MSDHDLNKETGSSGQEANSEVSQYWLDKSANVTKVAYAVYGVCALLLLLDFLNYKDHPHFVPPENWFGFYGWYGFISCVGLVLAAKVLRVVLKREEDYYDG